jgi:hypothetical protein
MMSSCNDSTRHCACFILTELSPMLQACSMVRLNQNVSVQGMDIASDQATDATSSV